MSELITVDISAESIVRYKKRVNMSRKDYEKYLAICEEHPRDIDNRLLAIAIKYDFEPSHDVIEDIADPEEVEFTLVTDKSQITTGDKEDE